MAGVDAQVPIECWYYPRTLKWGWIPECPNWCLAQGYQGCPNCLWTRQDDLESARSCNELSVWVQVLLGLTGRWIGGVEDVVLSSIAPEVTWISQNCQKGVTECNKKLALPTQESMMLAADII